MFILVHNKKNPYLLLLFSKNFYTFYIQKYGMPVLHKA